MSKNIEINLTDTHCHLNYIPTEDIKPAIDRAYQSGIKRMITIGTDYTKSLDAIKIAENYDNIYATVGVHPSDAKTYRSEHYDKFLSIATHKKVIAIGEIGLDFYRDNSPRPIQEYVFTEFINMALDLSKPIIVHNRDSSGRLIEILSSELERKNCSGIIHCYNGDKLILDWAISNNFYISIAGNVTYKNAVEIKEKLKYIPLDRLLIETDSPFLTPSKMRGKVKNNEPSFVKYTFDFIVTELDIDPLTLASRLEDNILTLFPAI